MSGTDKPTMGTLTEAGKARMMFDMQADQRRNGMVEVAKYSPSERRRQLVSAWQEAQRKSMEAEDQMYAARAVAHAAMEACLAEGFTPWGDEIPKRVSEA